MNAANEHFREFGYARFQRVVPRENCDAAVAAIFRFVKMDPEDPSSWYGPPVNEWGTVNLTHDQALLNNRQHPSVHAAFAAILGTNRLWVTMDQFGFKPPHSTAHPEYNF